MVIDIGKNPSLILGEQIDRRISESVKSLRVTVVQAIHKDQHGVFLRSKRGEKSAKT